MKWTTKQPKVSGYYWLRTPVPETPGMWFGPKVVKVKIDNDPEFPEATYSSCNYEMDWDFEEGAKWSGPIPPPEE